VITSIDVRNEVTIDYGGSDIVVPPHSQRVFLEVWRNGAMEVLFYNEAQPDCDSSDRIHWMVTGFDGERRGFLMNVEDAIASIRGLSLGIQYALAADVPVKPGDSNGK
jgi:hypothetical protein